MATSTAPVAPPPSPRRSLAVRVARGCLVLALLAGSCVGAAVWQFRSPARHAEALKTRLHPGMTLAEVAGEVVGSGRFLTWVTVLPDTPAVWLNEDSAGVGDEPRVMGRSAAVELFRRRSGDLRVQRLRVMYLTSVPIRSSIVVEFGPDGRVTSVAGPYNRAD
jgi:hypothetical protein